MALQHPSPQATWLGIVQNRRGRAGRLARLNPRKRQEPARGRGRQQWAACFGGRRPAQPGLRRWAGALRSYKDHIGCHYWRMACGTARLWRIRSQPYGTSPRQPLRGYEICCFPVPLSLPPMSVHSSRSPRRQLLCHAALNYSRVIFISRNLLPPLLANHKFSHRRRRIPRGRMEKLEVGAICVSHQPYR